MADTSNLKDNWLDQLSNHGIFQLSVAEGKRLRDLRNAAQQRPGNNFTIGFGSTQQRCTRLLALRGNDLFLAVGSCIRVLNLTEFKNAWIDTTEQLIESDLNDIQVSHLLNMPHKTLETPGIDFDIDTILPNSNGALLAVAGEHQLAVVCLPRKGFSSQSDPSMAVISNQTVFCKTLIIGQNLYTPSTRLLKIDWHPLSETRTHLMVLSGDSMLRMFDVSTNIDDPEQQFDLTSSQRKSSSKIQQTSITVDDEMEQDEEVSTFALGGISHDSSGWEPFTVYYTLENGHMYALCPVLPSKSMVRRQHLESLACMAITNCNKILSESKENDNDPVNPVYYYFRLQFEWICDLIKTAQQEKSTSLAMMDRGQLFVKSDPTSTPLQVQPQGPFIIKQNQWQDKTSPTKVSDMLFVQSNGLNVIALGFTNGIVRNYLLAGGISGQWILPSGKSVQQSWYKELSMIQSSVAFLPRATLHETIQFKTPQLNNAPIWLVNDSIYNDTYYAYHAAGVHAISTKEWMDQLLELKKKVQSQDGDEVLTSYIQKENTSQVRCLVNTAPFETGTVDPIIGMVVLSDTFLSYSLLSLDANCRMIGVDMNLRNVMNRSSELNKVMKSTVDDSLTSYQPLLSFSEFEPPKTLQNLINSSNAKVVIPPELGGNKEVVITKETLNFLVSTATKIRQDIRDVTKCVSQMNTRLATQKQEYERQIETLSDLYERASLYKSDSTAMNKIKSAQKKHTEISLRIDRMLCDISNAKQLGLSYKEKEWIDKVDSMDKEVKGYLQRMEKLRSQINSYQKSTKEEKKPIKSRLSTSQAAIVMDTLDIQEQVIDDLKTRVDKLKLEEKDDA
ncbi:uncharacterized protein BX664DRAFT_389129 [Halteromyces radiatus]|uniref:uncharacterized protein n=1 Tax=Halteromyces radiatus TaxID=101107 RepID=UPI00221E590C|nr:uncharacterized protein BX664DRAFT_389129 [Halteromyces radiatus]KAI8078740.1 hypothetical protein BX664DRAFT_389129 [Halteromyces radiatus]